MGHGGSDSPFHVMVKPAGPACNLRCDYCYYLGKQGLLFGADWRRRMSDELLERFIREYVEAHRGLAEIAFAWQGGEPTLMGVDFFRRAVELQRRLAPPGAKITNSIQTNGTLLDDEWGEFLAANHFLVGLSLDGPRELHDAFRKDKAGRGTFDQAMAGLDVLCRHKADFNALVVVNRKNAARPLDVYRFLRDQAGVRFCQFIPCVERTDFETVAPGRWPSESLPMLGELSAHPGGFESVVTPWSVDPDDFGDFLVAIFDEWLRRDVGEVFVQTFDTALGQWMGLGSALCVFAPSCGAAVAMEHDGSVYACDHYVYPEYRLGRLGETPLAEMVRSRRQHEFGREKSARLPRYCRDCDVRFACNGECPKNRFLRTPEGEPGLNYLCPGLRRFFRHVDPWMKLMATELRAGRPASNVMLMARGNDFGFRNADCRLKGKRTVSQSAIRNPQSEISRPGPNDPCPCGSGRKFKKCCMRK